MKNYRICIKTTAVFQFITAATHAISLFATPTPGNETEKQLYNLMSTYQFDLGVGFHRTMDQLTLTLSACLCLLCLLAGLINFYLVKRVGADIIKGIININLLVFGILFILTAVFAFILPIVQVGVILLCLIVTRIILQKNSGTL